MRRKQEESEECRTSRFGGRDGATLGAAGCGGADGRGAAGGAAAFTGGAVVAATTGGAVVLEVGTKATAGEAAAAAGG